MKISLCSGISLSYGGGGEKWAWTFAAYLRSRGHEVEILAFPYAPGNRRPVNVSKVIGDVEYHESWSHKIDSDVAYFIYNPLAYLFFRGSCPRIAGFHTDLYFLDKTPSIRYGFVPVFSKMVYGAIGRADLSAYDAIHLVNREARIQHRRCYHIPNFVDANRYKPAGPRGDKFTVLYVGRAVWQKGWDLVARIMELTRLKDPDIEFVWVGGNTHDNGSHLRSLGYISDEKRMAEIYSSAHATLFPSRHEGGYPPLAVLESLACGTPAIVSPLDLYKDIRLPLIYGSDEAEFADRIVELKKNWTNNEYDVVGKVCRSSVGRFDSRVVLPQLEDMMVAVWKRDYCYEDVLRAERESSSQLSTERKMGVQSEQVPQ